MREAFSGGISHLSLLKLKSSFSPKALEVSGEVPGAAGDGSGVLQALGLGLQVSQ